MRLIKNSLWFSLLLVALLIPFTAQAQKGKRSKRAKSVRTQEAPPAPPVGSPLETALEIGGDFINSAARLLGGDPYAAFRQSKYSNEGLLNETDEARLGFFVDREVRKRYTPTLTGQARLDSIGQRLVKNSLRPDLKYRFFVVNSKEINALSIPGGYIYVTTALMNLANDDELASVVGHEIGHVTARHGLKSVKHAQALGQVAQLLGAVVGRGRQ